MGPLSTSEVATVSITFSPMTLGEPNTQNTSAHQRDCQSDIWPLFCSMLLPASSTMESRPRIKT